MNIDSLNIAPLLIEGLTACQYQSLTDVQQVVVPFALSNNDDLGVCAPTGTGKTAAFAIPLLQQLLASDDVDNGAVKVLIMTPTRELAIQIGENIEQYAQFTDIKVLTVYGGSNINPQRKALAKGIDILVATPGRLFDLCSQYGLQLDQVTQLVIDEADRMLDMGFVKDIQKAKRLLAPQHRTMLFSATFTEQINALANTMLAKPKWINVSAKAGAAKIDEQVFLLDKRRKSEFLAETVGRQNLQQVMVFVNSKESAELLAHELLLDGLSCAVLHGDKSQGSRNRSLADFKAGKVKLLVATDIAARGIDIQNLPLVVNYELPEEIEDYTHRIGRTGRAGNQGLAWSLISPIERQQLHLIEQDIERQLSVSSPAGYEIGAPLPERYRELMTKKPKKLFTPKKYEHKKKTSASRQGKWQKKSK